MHKILQSRIWPGNWTRYADLCIFQKPVFLCTLPLIKHLPDKPGICVSTINDLSTRMWVRSGSKWSLNLLFFSAQASNVLRDLIAYSHIYVISYFGCVPRYNKFGLLSVKSAKPLLTQLETPGPIDRTPGIPGTDKKIRISTCYSCN